MPRINIPPNFFWMLSLFLPQTVDGRDCHFRQQQIVLSTGVCKLVLKIKGLHVEIFSHFLWKEIRVVNSFSSSPSWGPSISNFVFLLVSCETINQTCSLLPPHHVAFCVNPS